MKETILNELAKWHLLICLATATAISAYAVFFGGIPVLNSLLSFLYLFFIGAGTFLSSWLIFRKSSENRTRLPWVISGFAVTAVAAHLIVYSIYLFLFDIETNLFGKRLILAFIVTGFIGFFDIRFLSNKQAKKQEEENQKLPEIWQTGFPVKQRNRTSLIDYKDIFFIKAEDKYASVITDQKEFLSTKTITWLESNLPKKFVRVHRSYIINTDYFNKMEFVSGSKPVIILRQKAEIPVGNTYLQRVKALFQS